MGHVGLLKLFKIKLTLFSNTLQSLLLFGLIFYFFNKKTVMWTIIQNEIFSEFSRNMYYNLMKQALRQKYKHLHGLIIL